MRRMTPTRSPKEREGQAEKSERSERSARHERPPRPHHRNPEQHQQSRQAVMKFPGAIVAIVAIAGTVSNGSLPADTSKTIFESRGSDKTNQRYRGSERSKRSICPNNNLKNGTPSHPARLIQSPMSFSICRPPRLAAGTQWLDRNREYEDNAGGQRVHAHQNVPNHPRRPFQSSTMCNQLATSLAVRAEWNHQELDGTRRQRVRAPQKLDFHHPTSGKPAIKQELSAPGAPNPLAKVNPFERSRDILQREARVQEKKGCVSTQKVR